MLKAFAIKFLLGRGIDALTELAAKTVRHSMTTAGGAMMAHGIASSDQVSALTGGAVALVGIGLSYLRTFLSKRVSP